MPPLSVIILNQKLKYDCEGPIKILMFRSKIDPIGVNILQGA